MTPSAQAHLGHARSFLFFDVLRRYLTHRGYRVTYVQNVTDIDDRSIEAGRKTGEDYHAMIDRNYAEFKNAMRKFGILEYDSEPYATDYIPQIQQMIRSLIERGHAYTTSDGIYYRVSTFPNYGKLANRNVEELEAGARIEIDEGKEDPLDFALWKFAKPDEPKWPFEPYGQGRPGWHIECSAMSRELLDPQGKGFDIHGGGADLIFPHHENEIAQSEPLMQHPPMANFWVHGGLLLFDSRKMSKSLGNFEPLAEMVERYDPQAIRLLFLQTGYRKVMNFTEEAIAATTGMLRQLKKAYRILHTDEPAPTIENVNGLLGHVDAALSEDMNTAVVVAEVANFARNAQRLIDGGGNKAELFGQYRTVLDLIGIEPNEEWLQEPKAELSPDFIAKLGAALQRAGASSDITETLDGASPESAIERVIALRSQARARKDWNASDRLRDALSRCGIELHDAKDGTTWTAP
jgi:cysteinyl-tRNA synthetase